MRRSLLLLIAGAAVVVAAACRDSAVAPQPARDAFEPTEHGRESNSRTVLGTFTISPNGGTYRIGDFELVVPAGAVCDPATAKYGPLFWDDECAPALRNVTVTVSAVTSRGIAHIDFQPDLRFKPRGLPVILRTSAFAGLLTSDAVRQLPANASYFQRFTMLYAHGNMRVDEALSTGDESLMTHVELQSGMIWRRVKHFSGYLISSGAKCDPTPEATCQTDSQPDQPTVAESGPGSGPVTVVVTP